MVEIIFKNKTSKIENVIIKVNNNEHVFKGDEAIHLCELAGHDKNKDKLSQFIENLK